jgi:hypothetical protein
MAMTFKTWSFTTALSIVLALLPVFGIVGKWIGKWNGNDSWADFGLGVLVYVAFYLAALVWAVRRGFRWKRLLFFPEFRDAERRGAVHTDRSSERVRNVYKDEDELYAALGRGKRPEALMDFWIDVAVWAFIGIVLTLPFTLPLVARMLGDSSYSAFDERDIVWWGGTAGVAVIYLWGAMIAITHHRRYRHRGWR